MKSPEEPLGRQQEASEGEGSGGRRERECPRNGINRRSEVIYILIGNGPAVRCDLCPPQGALLSSLSPHPQRRDRTVNFVSVYRRPPATLPILVPVLATLHHLLYRLQRLCSPAQNRHHSLPQAQSFHFPQSLLMITIRDPLHCLCAPY